MKTNKKINIQIVTVGALLRLLTKLQTAIADQTTQAGKQQVM